ncbi:MAG: hypothetical protein AAF770_02830 [Bacteroidota bacterium]
MASEEKNISLTKIKEKSIFLMESSYSTPIKERIPVIRLPSKPLFSEAGRHSSDDLFLGH